MFIVGNEKVKELQDSGKILQDFAGGFISKKCIFGNGLHDGLWWESWREEGKSAAHGWWSLPSVALSLDYSVYCATHTTNVKV